MIFGLVGLILCYIVWCLEGGHSALIILRLQVGLLMVGTSCALIGIVQVLRQIIY